MSPNIGNDPIFFMQMGHQPQSSKILTENLVYTKTPHEHPPEMWILSGYKRDGISSGVAVFC